MGAPWVQHPSWELAKVASEVTGRDVERLLLEADQEELTETHNAQLATFVLSLIVLDAVERLGVEPGMVAGHSLGEYSALVASGALSFEEGCTLVLERGEGMRDAAGDQPGTMYAVLGLDDDQVDVACRRADGEAWVANYNSPGQVVIAGDREALERAGNIAKELGAKRAVALPVGGAFHTPYMAPARDRLRKALANTNFRDPEVPLVANVDNQAHNKAGEWPELCSAQLCSPVRWRHSVETLASLGTTMFLELGPGNVLTGLNKRIVPDAKSHNVSTPDDLDKLVEALAHSQAQQQEIAKAEEAAPHADGEHIFMHERLIVSQANGLFAFLEGDGAPRIGDGIDVGTTVGMVGDNEVRTPFAGKLMGMLAIEGERVTSGQPIAWLRTER